MLGVACIASSRVAQECHKVGSSVPVLQKPRKWLHRHGCNCARAHVAHAWMAAAVDGERGSRRTEAGVTRWVYKCGPAAHW